MTLDLSGLEKLKAKRPPKKKPEWQPLDLNTLHAGTYLAADQSISAFGLVLFEVTPEGQYAVHMAQKFSQSPYEGHEGLLRNVELLEAELASYIRQWVSSHDWGVVRAVHETPPVNKGRMARPEVSLLTAYAWRRVTSSLPRLPSVGRQHHCLLICGNGNADKKIHHAALKELCQHQVRGFELVTNEAHRDALSIALAAAKRGY